MMHMTETPASAAGSWRELLGRDYGGATTVLAGGVAIYAINEFITMSLLPSAIADIGGVRLYAWVTTVSPARDTRCGSGAVVVRAVRGACCNGFGRCIPGRAAVGVTTTAPLGHGSVTARFASPSRVLQVCSFASDLNTEWEKPCQGPRLGSTSR